MPKRGPLPPRRDYPDLPAWDHNQDTVNVRLINAAWHALFKTDLLELTFKALAAEVGITTPAVYHYYPTLTALGEELGVAAGAKLRTDLLKDIPEEDSFEGFMRKVLTNYLRFAEERPRHFALIFNPLFNDAKRFPGLQFQRKRLVETMVELLEADLERKPTPAETHIFWSMLHGSATLIAGGQSGHSRALVQAIEKHLSTLKASRR